jgi:transcriptional regulator (araC/xylS family)
VLIYLFVNFVWLKKSNTSAKQLDERNIYIKDILTKQINGIFISCNESLNIVSSSAEFQNFYDFNQKSSNLKDAIVNSNFLDGEQKENFLNEIKTSQNSGEIRYFNIDTIKDSIRIKYLVTTTPLDNNFPCPISLLFQDISSMRQSQEKIIDESYNAYIEKLILFIKQNIEDDGLCIEKLAKVGGYSKFHLQRLFKNYTNANIEEYLRSFRLSRAEFLLKFTDKKVSAIAKKCRFTHIETFVRTFSKTYGNPPLAYKQNLPTYIPINKLIYEEIEMPTKKLAITHDANNIGFLNFKQKSDNVFVLLENGDANSKVYGVESKDSELSYLELSGGKWAKIDIKNMGLSMQEVINKACSIFYDPNLYNFKAPQIYFILTNDNTPDFIYFKI